MPEPAVAIIGATIASAAISSKSAKKAANQQAASADTATQAQLDMFEQGQKNQAPYMAGGNWAMEKLTGSQGTPIWSNAPQGGNALSPGAQTNPYNLPPNVLAALYRGEQADLSGYGIPGYGQGQGTYDVLPTQGAAPPGSQMDGGYWNARYQAPQSLGQQAPSQPAQAPWITGYVPGTATKGLLEDPSQLVETAGYKFNLAEGLKAQERAASSTGRLGSGAYVKDATKYASGLASQEYQNAINNYMNLAQLGQGAASGQATNALSTGRGIAVTGMAGGEAQAAGTLGGAYPWTQALNYGGNQLARYYTKPSYNPFYGAQATGNITQLGGY